MTQLGKLGYCVSPVFRLYQNPDGLKRVLGEGDVIIVLQNIVENEVAISHLLQMLFAQKVVLASLGLPTGM